MKLEIGNFNIQMLHHDPMVYTVEGVLSDIECDHFMKIAEHDMKRSLVSGLDEEKNKRGLLDKRRTSSNCWVSHSFDDTTRKVGERISKLVQIPVSHAEEYQVLHYVNDQEYQPHLDTFDPSVKEFSHYLNNGGQRIITALAYLNDVEEGGETSFPNINQIVTPKKGKIAVFHDCYKGTDTPHPDSLHGALPVLSGEKWAFNLWFRKHPRTRKYEAQ